MQLYCKVQKSVGRMIMPTVELPDGTWLQDTSDIIDEFERQYPERSVVPGGPTQRVASLLMELYGDEWLPMAALHYRWDTPANAQFALSEFSRSALPLVPTALGIRFIRRFASKMQGYLPILGVTEATKPGVEHMATQLIADLNVHLEQHPFLLGGRPCIGDFGLFGPLWGHLYRDPGSTHLFDNAPHVVRWMNQLLEPADIEGDFLPDDEVPATLDPIFKRQFAEQIPWVTTLVEHINQWCEDNPAAKRVRGAIGTADFVVGGVSGQRKLATFVQWKAQRSILHYQQMADADRTAVDRWLNRVDGAGALDISIKFPFERRNFKAVIAGR